MKKAQPPQKVKSRAELALDRFHEETSLEQTYDASNLRKLWPFVKPHAKWLGLSIFILLITTGLALTRTLLIGRALDAAHTPEGGKVLTETAIEVGIMLLIEQTLAFPQVYAMQYGGARAMADLRRHVFRFLHTRKLGFFDRTPVGRLVTRVTNDIDAINEMFASGALNAFGDLLRLVIIVVLLVQRDWRLSLLAFVAVPPVAIAVNWTRRRIRDAYRAVRTKTARMNAYLNEQISGMAVVQAYAREAESAGEFDDINLGYRDANNRSIILDSALDASIEAIASICVASVLWYAGARTLAVVTSFGTLYVFVDFIDKFFVPIRDLSARYTLVQSAMAGAERVFELLENKDEDCPPPAASKAANGKAKNGGGKANAFELEDVTFSYKEGVPVLKDVSIAAKAGEKVALVGATGAGKSTVAAVLLRLYDIDRGRVLVFGEDVTELTRSALRTKFAVVPQDVFLFPGSVATNIAAGDADVDRPKVVRALERIGALDLFERREGGLDAPVLERGGNFSAGERQLIAFARALYRDPPILVLDEATANVDSDTEARLQRAVDGAMKGRTALIIAHRLSTIRAVDRIIVFHKGKVVEQGSHDELMELEGVYAKLYRLQFAKEKAQQAAASSAPAPAE